MDNNSLSLQMLSKGISSIEICTEVIVR